MEAKQSAGEEPQQTPQPQPNTPILSTGAIVGLIVGGVVFVLLLAVLIGVKIRQNRKRVELKTKNGKQNTSKDYTGLYGEALRSAKRYDDREELRTPQLISHKIPRNQQKIGQNWPSRTNQPRQ